MWRKISKDSTAITHFLFTVSKDITISQSIFQLPNDRWHLDWNCTCEYTIRPNYKSIIIVRESFQALSHCYFLIFIQYCALCIFIRQSSVLSTLNCLSEAGAMNKWGLWENPLSRGRAKVVPRWALMIKWISTDSMSRLFLSSLVRWQPLR